MWYNFNNSALGIEEQHTGLDWRKEVKQDLYRSDIYNYIYIYMYIYIYILAVKPAFGGLLCYGASSTAFRRKRSDASVLSRALLMSALLITESCATEVRSCPWPQCDSASG